MVQKSNIVDSIESFKDSDVIIESQETVYSGFFTIEKFHVRHPLFGGGMSETIDREMMDRGDAAALVPYDPVRDTIVLVEQFRIGALAAKAEHVWQLEIVAGVIDKEGENAENVAYRECEEEAGITPMNIRKILSYYPSAGGCSESIALYVGCVDSSKAVGVHGVEEENEDIRVHVVKRETAIQWIEEGKIENAASIIGIQWLQMNYKMLQQDWCPS